MSMFNSKSSLLTILIATYNRFPILKKVISSIESGTKCSSEIIVIDGGSTDGTVNYLKKNKNVTPIFQGKLLGTARTYNSVWREINSKYTTWLSDDTIITAGSLDLAIDILEKHPEIGMVGLKMRDVTGPWKKEEYMGGISPFGILNCNHGVLPLDILASIGYFNENYHSYTIDPDLTASVLCTGKKVVMTKRICIFHDREWSNNLSQGEFEKFAKESMKGINNEKIYYNKFKFLNTCSRSKQNLDSFLRSCMAKIFLEDDDLYIKQLGLNQRDWNNIIKCRFIKISDPIFSFGRPYHLIQQIPKSLLKSKTNPYRHLLKY